MTAIDPIPLLPLSRAADLGHYNLAELLDGAMAAPPNREWFTASLVS